MISLVVGLENLKLNDQQINQLQDHLLMQDEDLLKKIIEQNDFIIKQNEDIFTELRGMKK